MGWKFTLSLFVMSILFSWQLSGQTDCGSTFFDLGGQAGNYANNEIADWTFCPDNPGDLVTLNFTSVAVEACCDDLGIFDGSGMDMPLNLDLEAPASFTSSADDGCLTVTWSSDGSVTLGGWEATVSCAPPPPCPNPTLLTLVNATATGAVVQWNQVGDVNLWDVEVVVAGTAPTGTPTNTDITASPYTWDEGTSGTVYELYLRGQCADEGEFTNWVGPVVFTTNPACGDSFFDTGGENGDYQNNELETWVFCPDNAGDLVTLNFVFVDVEGCCDDLAVYSGSDTSTPLNLDIEAPESFSSVSDDGCMTVTWDSDGSVVNGGWEAIISCAPAPPCPNPTFFALVNATTTGATVQWSQVGNVNLWDVEVVPAGTPATGTPTNTDIAASPYTWADGDSGTEYDMYLRGQCEDEGEFTNWVGPVTFTTTPGCGDFFYDTGGAAGDHMPSENITYVFCPDNPGNQVTLAFLSVDIDPFGSTLAIYNGTGTDNVLNGDLETADLFTSNTDDGCLTVTFMSGAFGTNPGWTAVVTCNPPPPCPNPSNLSVADVTTEGATLGWLENGDATSWNIEIITSDMMPTGTPTFTGVTDNPFVWDGAESGTEYFYYVQAECGFDDETSNWIGPFAFRTIPGCGDTFFDTGGPNGSYQNNELETWLFCPDTPGETVVLNFTAVNVEGCCDDLAVFNGNSQDDPFTLDLETPAIFTSTADDGCLLVTFDSDGSVALGGWSADVLCTPCPPVFAADVSVANIAAVQADVFINTNIIGGSFEVEIDTVGFTQGTGVMFSAEGTEMTVTGLTENTTYEFYLTSICPDGQPNDPIGPFSFTTLFMNDVGISGLVSPTDECGLSVGEAIRVQITNYGANPQTLFPLNFSVNGVLAGVSQPQDGFYTGIISRDSTEIFEFDLDYDFDEAGQYVIELWTEMMTDSNSPNDTFTVVLNQFAPPLYEDFEAGVIPDYINIDEPSNYLAAPGVHGAPSWVVSEDFFGGQDRLIVDLPVISGITSEDTLYFDYRYVDFFAPDIVNEFLLTNTDSLKVLASTDCGETYDLIFAISGDDHVATTNMTLVGVPLENYEGEKLKLRIEGELNNNFNIYTLDIDNINIYRCENLDLAADVIGSMPGLDDGQITITPSGGIGPFEYEWEDGSTEGIRNDLAVGDYSVSVTDRFGCTGQLIVTVDFFVGTNELPTIISDLRLAPNPTYGQSSVNATFTEALDVQVDVVNLLGQSVWRGPLQQNVTEIQQTVDLSQAPAGIYMVRVQAAGQSVSRKLIKSN